MSRLKACLLSMAMLMASCAGEHEDPGPPYRAQVITMDETKSAESAVSFTVRNVDLPFLESTENLKSRFFQFLGGGQLKVEEVEGSQAIGAEYTGGGKLPLRFKEKNGILIPRDYSSLILLSAYHQLASVFQNLDTLLGITAEQYFAKNGRIDVLFEPGFIISQDGIQAEVTQKLNAAFVPMQEIFVLFRRSAVESVPIAANLQVIAHEFGHAAFEQSFYRNAFAATGRLEQEPVIAGFNEGYADILSWAVSGSADVLSASIDFPGISDLRNFSQNRFTFEGMQERPESCLAGIYCVGTIFAASVLAAHQELGLTNAPQDRWTTSREIYRTLTLTKTQMEAYQDTLMPSPLLSPGRTASGLVPVTSYDGRVSSVFLRAFLENLRSDWVKPYCVALIARFGESGFSLPAREGLCL